MSKVAEKTKIQPLGDRVLLKRNKNSEAMRGGIYIPDSAQEAPQTASVVALGTGGKDKDGKAIAFNVKKGDQVLISKYGGTEVKIDGDEFVIVREEDILGVISK